tara:strand:- start:6122 stop:6937 length:816 start_codon:yes stop_codon:yes gene_type:complete
MIKKIRLDVFLFNKGLVDSREKGRKLILAGKVKDKYGKVLDKPGQEIYVESELTISAEPKFVSRGGDKLLEAFERFPLNVNNRICIDAGISTGGFTDCLLQHGAKKVYGIDVGYGQTSWIIRNNPKVELFERTNIRYLNSEIILSKEEYAPDFVVADLSFISLRLVLQPIKSLLNTEFHEGVFLIKPQFEVGKEFVSKGGVVKESKYHLIAIDKFIETATKGEWKINGLIASPLKGPAGNHEYLIWMSNKKINDFEINKEYINNLIKETIS